MKYLNEQLLRSNLKLSKSVEYWLGVDKNENYIALKWLRIDVSKNNEYSVKYFEVFDEGNEDFLDIYEFSSVDPDEPYLEKKYETIENLLEHVKTEYQCDYNKFVNAGLIQDEYLAYLQQK